MGDQKIKKINTSTENLGRTALKPEHTSVEPKFIRGPTEYKPANAKTIKSRPKGSSDTMDEVKLRPRQGKQKAAQFIDSEDFDHAQMSMGELPDKRRVLLTVHKNEKEDLVNSHTDQSVDLVRAKPLFKRSLTTYSENMAEAFCQIIDSNLTGNQFMKYLEQASQASETEALTEIFPFLDQSGHVKTLQELMRRKAALVSQFPETEEVKQTALLAEINGTIDQMRAKIYDDHLKKIQFKTRIEQVLKEVPQKMETEDSEAEYWLWVWLRKLLSAVVENIQDTQDRVHETLGEPLETENNTGMIRD